MDGLVARGLGSTEPLVVLTAHDSHLFRPHVDAAQDWADLGGVDLVERDGLDVGNT